MPKRLEQIPIALDQLVNTVCGGWADETISSRAWRMRTKSTAWSWLRETIDFIFRWQKDHCKTSYESELERRHLPPELR